MTEPGAQTFARKTLSLAGWSLSYPLRVLQRHSNSGIILLYHRVSPRPDPFYSPLHPDVFRHQLECLGTLYEFVPLQEIVRRLTKGLSLRRLCAVTFDDGFADFEEFAYPVLTDLQVPVTHFVTVDGIVEGKPTWNYRLNRLLHSHRFTAQLEASPRPSPPERWEFTTATNALARWAPDKREAWLQRMETAIPLPADPPMLRAADVARLSPDLVRWGSHTVTHPTLPYCSEEVVTYELNHSRELLGSLLNVPIQYVAYPNAAFDKATMSGAARSGYDAAFTAYQRRVGPASSLHAVPRFDISELPDEMISLELSGITPALRRLRNVEVKSRRYRSR